MNGAYIMVVQRKAMRVHRLMSLISRSAPKMIIDAELILIEKTEKELSNLEGNSELEIKIAKEWALEKIDSSQELIFKDDCFSCLIMTEHSKIFYEEEKHDEIMTPNDYPLCAQIRLDKKNRKCAEYKPDSVYAEDFKDGDRRKFSEHNKFIELIDRGILTNYKRMLDL